MQNKFLSIIVIIFVAIGISCSAPPRKKNFEFMEEQKVLQDEITGVDTTQAKPIYITGTLPIDKADEDKLIFDIFRINIDKYPETVSFHARVYDSSGNFITNMAKPYKRNDEINYFTGLKEQLGKHYNIR